MGKRASSPPRRPRDPVARAVRTPRFKQQVVPDKRSRERLKARETPAARDKQQDGDESTD